MWFGAIALVTSSLAVVSVHLTPYTSNHLADWWLAAPERALGVSGPQLAAVLERSPSAGFWRLTYAHTPQLWLILLAWKCDNRTLRRLVSALALSGVLGLAFYVLEPARGPTLTLTGYLPSPWYASWIQIRDGASVYPDQIYGYIQCPSFHTVLAVLIALAAPKGKIKLLVCLWLPFLLLSTWTFGEHYLLDIVLGAALALFCWRACELR